MYPVGVSHTSSVLFTGPSLTSTASYPERRGRSLESETSGWTGLAGRVRRSRGLPAEPRVGGAARVARFPSPAERSSNAHRNLLGSRPFPEIPTTRARRTPSAHPESDHCHDSVIGPAAPLGEGLSEHDLNTTLSTMLAAEAAGVVVSVDETPDRPPELCLLDRAHRPAATRALDVLNPGAVPPHGTLHRVGWVTPRGGFTRRTAASPCRCAR